jgi:DNA-damage-inducible protein J
VVHSRYNIAKEDFTMPKTEFIRARVDEHLKADTEVIFTRLGLSMTDAITLFLTQCKLQQGLPFEVRIPNEETRRALEEAHAGIGIISHASANELFESWDEEC